MYSYFWSHDEIFTIEYSSAWWNSFHIFSLLLSHILHLSAASLLPLKNELLSQGFKLSLTSPWKQLNYKWFGANAIISTQTRVHTTNTYRNFKKHLVETTVNYCDCSQIALFCVCVTVDASCVCFEGQRWFDCLQRQRNSSLADLFHHTGQYHLPCGRMKGLWWIIFKKCHIDFYALHTILCVHNKILTVT